MNLHARIILAAFVGSFVGSAAQTAIILWARSWS